MKKIYYLQKHEVKLGDVIEYAGIRTILTEELIELNPELFIVKDTMQELIDEAKRRYPIGTVYKHFNSKYTINSPDMLTVSEMDHHFSFGASIWVMSEAYKGIVYEDGEWAEILPLKFTTEDGVDIYGDMETYAVHRNNPNTKKQEVFGGNSPNLKYFYYEKNALAYIEKHKEKSLGDYEQMLFKKDDSMTFSPKSAYFSVYGWIKDNDPKLYYTKLLQLIADDLHGERYTHIYMDTSYHINNAYGVNVHCGDDEGCVYFKSNKLAIKARDILGSKIKYLFNQA